MSANLQYRVKPVSPEAHLFEVTLRIVQPDDQGQLLVMPSWILGSYMIRDFAKNLVTLSAYSDGIPVAWEKQDKQSWLFAPYEGELVVTYTIYAWDLSVRSAHLDTTHGYFNGTSLFLRVEGQDDQPCEVELIKPDGDGYESWRVATTLNGLQAPYLGFGSYQAGSYDELVDHPVEMGTFDYSEFDVAGVTHAVAVTGRHEADMERLCADLKMLCESHIEMFGELPEMDRYLFQVMAVGDGYGGLEHRSSTSLICKRADLPKKGEEKVTNGYRQFLGLASHEYFHLWNVKRIRPEVFKSADLIKEVHTRLLWAFEGITSYYDDLSLVRTKRIEPESYLELLAQVITRVQRGAGRFKQSLADSSFDAWTKFYKQDENASNAIVSYYAKGALVALALDLTIRKETAGNYSLEDVMRTLWERHGRVDVGVHEQDVEMLAMEVTSIDLKAFFDQAVRGTEELALETLLEYFGIGYKLCPAKSPDDQGSGKQPENSETEAKPVLGARVKNNNGHVELAVVLDGGAAQQAGLSAGDTLVAINGIRVTNGNVHDLVAAGTPGEPVQVHAFRRDELMAFDLKPQPAPADTCHLWLLESPEPETETRRNEWLGSA
ncbi:M61 family metallopeptidase [Solemya velesiana gill symbiont]|uniref:Peptidase M61 n=1 Tax=Solemya velesiana gill symbiont TaxID=1918948 RepID=A0A1T2KP52_9GAMM|nr:PDZ domain-containing protein [Solemya velesiana gill symbiont]OOZ34615.1 peptidase M61 [Solemya velesiana gill symbiont]